MSLEQAIEVARADAEPRRKILDAWRDRARRRGSAAWRDARWCAIPATPARTAPPRAGSAGRAEPRRLGGGGRRTEGDVPALRRPHRAERAGNRCAVVRTPAEEAAVIATIATRRAPVRTRARIEHGDGVRIRRAASSFASCIAVRRAHDDQSPRQSGLACARGPASPARASAAAWRGTIRATWRRSPPSPNRVAAAYRRSRGRPSCRRRRRACSGREAEPLPEGWRRTSRFRCCRWWRRSGRRRATSAGRRRCRKPMGPPCWIWWRRPSRGRSAGARRARPLSRHPPRRRAWWRWPASACALPGHVELSAHLRPPRGARAGLRGALTRR